MHISFVRSIAMDSWTDAQLALMKGGGNDKCNQYLQQHGIDARTPIKQKYESPAAQLYKEVLKARVEGRPEPTELPKPVPKKPYQPQSQQQQQQQHGMGSTDAQGMERLVGETDQQYVARQTRLRDEAKARMAAKFGAGGLGGGNSSSSRGGMQGMGSDPNYNPNAGGYGSGAAGADRLLSGIGAGIGSVWGAATSVASSLQDEQTVQSIKSTGASFWGNLSSSVSQVATSITQPNDAGADGLADLQRQVASQKPMQSKYSGFGSEHQQQQQRNQHQPPQRQVHSFGGASTPSSSMMPGVQEAPGLPHEDRNGVERLTGESEAQYVARQTRLRDEARARMAAKFGGGGINGLSSASSTSTPSANRFPAPASANFAVQTTPSRPTPARSAPSSGNAPKLNNSNTTDFFSSFGT